MDNIILHIGLYKCGSTFIQENIFSKIPNINYIRSKKLEDYIVNKNKINIFSAEYMGYVVPHYYNNEKQINLYKFLKYRFPNAKVICVIRDKNSFLKSCYNQYIRGYGGIISYKKYLEKYGDIDLNKTIYNIKTIFDDVLFIDLKNLNDNLNLIFDFIGIEEQYVNLKKCNVSLSKTKICLIRLLNIFKLNLFFKYVYYKIN